MFKLPLSNHHNPLMNGPKILMVLKVFLFTMVRKLDESNWCVPIPEGGGMVTTRGVNGRPSDQKRDVHPYMVHMPTSVQLIIVINAYIYMYTCIEKNLATNG